MQALEIAPDALLGQGGEARVYALDTIEIAGSVVTIERRLPGRPMNQLLGKLAGEARDSLIRAYLEAASQIGDIIVDRPWYGDLLGKDPVHTAYFRAYLE